MKRKFHEGKMALAALGLAVAATFVTYNASKADELTGAQKCAVTADDFMGIPGTTRAELVGPLALVAQKALEDEYLAVSGNPAPAAVDGLKATKVTLLRNASKGDIALAVVGEGATEQCEYFLMGPGAIDHIVGKSAGA